MALENRLQKVRDTYLKTPYLYEATVESLQDDITNGYVKVRLTGVESQENMVNNPDHLYSAQVMSPFGGGDNYGFISIPPIGSNVLVAFKDGTFNRPIVLGSWYPRKTEIKSSSELSGDEISSVQNYTGNLRSYQSLTLNENYGTFDTASVYGSVNNLSLELGTTPDALISTLANTESPSSSVVDSALGFLEGGPSGLVADGVKTALTEFGSSGTDSGTMLSNIVNNAGNLASFSDSISSKIGAVSSGLLSKVSSIASGKLSGLSSISKGLISAAPGKLGDMLAGKIGQLPGLSDALANANMNLDSFFDSSFAGFQKYATDTLKKNLPSAKKKFAVLKTLYDKAMALQEKVKGVVDSIKDKLAGILQGGAGLIGKSMTGMATNLVNGSMPKIQEALGKLSPSVQGAILAKNSCISNAITSSLGAFGSSGLAGMAASVGASVPSSITGAIPNGGAIADMVKGAVSSGATGLAGSALSTFNNAFSKVASNLGSVSQAASLARSFPISKLSSATKLNDMVSDDIRVGQLHLDGYITESEAVNAISDPTGSYSMSIIKKFEDRNPGVASKRKVITGTVPSGTKNQTPSRTIEPFQLYSSQDRLDEQTKKGWKLVPEPLIYIWKSPKGHSIEIDDTGYSNTGKADGELSKKDQSQQQIPDNRGIRLTTTYGQIIHLTDEAGYENILIRDGKNNYLQFDTVANNCNLMVNNDMSETILGNVTTKIGKNNSLSVGKIMNVDVGDKLIITTKKETSLKSESLMIETKKDIAIKSGTTAHLFGKEQVSITTEKLTAGGSSQTNIGLGCAINTLGSTDASVTAVSGSKVGIEFGITGVPTAGFESKPTLPEVWLKVYISTVTDGSITLTPVAIRAVYLPGGSTVIPLT